MQKTILIITLLVGSLTSQLALSHCEIPCGIYGDNMRFEGLLEDVATIKKSINEFNKESNAKKINYNQLVRWVNNKEKYADNINQTMLTYFLTQRVKESDKTYTNQLIAVHKIILLAVKVKQSSDIAIADKLEKAIITFQKLYNSK